jgi:hypothetical protein
VGYVAKSGFRERENHIRLEFSHCLVKLPTTNQGPNQIFKVQNPFPQNWPKPGFFDFLEWEGQLDLRVDQQAFREISIARHMQFKWTSLDQMSVHHYPHPAVIMRWDDAG